MLKGKIGLQVVLIYVRSVFRSEDRWGREPEANSSLPREKKLPYSRAVWTPEATGGQLLLGGEDESEQNKYHQCPLNSELLVLERAVFWKRVLCCAVLIPFSTDWLLRLSAQSTSCSKDTKLGFVSILFFLYILSVYSSSFIFLSGYFSSSAAHKAMQFSVSLHWVAWNEQSVLVDGWIFAYMQRKEILCLVKLVLPLCLLFKTGHH